MPSPSSRSPWKVLILGIGLFTVCLVLAITAAAYWVGGWARNHNRRSERPAFELPRAVQSRAPQQASNTTARPQSPSRNAILAGKTRSARGGGEDIFIDCFVPELEIEFPKASASRLRASERDYVSVNIREGDHTYTNVAIRLKGGPGSFQRFDDTPSFTVNFDKFAPGQSFHGLKKIHLNSSVQDRTYLNEKISRELFEAAGVPVPRAGHAMVAFDERPPRLYVLLEGVNKQFLKRYFKDAKGNVYDGHSGTDVNSDMPVNCGEEDHKRLVDLARAAGERDRQRRLTRLEQTLDLDRFITFVAMEVMISHWDGYAMGVNNFRIAHDRDTDRMVFIPHGMDQVFGNRRESLMNPSVGGLVARAALDIPEVRTRYRQRVAELSTNVFRASEIVDRVREIAERVPLRSRTAPAYCLRIQQRAATLEHEINPDALRTSFEFERGAVLSLTNWASQTDLGQAELAQQTGENSETWLHIGTTSGCTASWRTTVNLPAGRYRFEAKIKTKGVVFEPNDNRAGAGLRISRHREEQKNAGDRDWFGATFEFEVSDDDSLKELICELRARQGEVFFDFNSLKLRRL